MINVKILLKTIRNNLKAFFIVIYILSPFFNEAFINLTNINLNYLVLSLFFIYFVIVIIEFFLFKKKILYSHIFIFLLMLILFNLSQISYLENTEKLLFVFLGFFCSFLILIDNDIINLKNLILKYFISVLILAILISVGNFDNLIKGFITHSRMIYNSNPISLSVLSALLVILISFLENNRVFKIIIILIGISLLIVFMSRGIIVSLGAVFLLILIIKKKYFSSVFIFFVSLIIFLIINNIRGEKNITERMDLQNLALESIEQNLLGYGVGYFSKISDFEYPHNSIIELILETGFIFSFLYFFFIFLIVINSIRKVQIEIFSIIFIFFNFILLFSYSSIDFMRILLPLLFLSLKESTIKKIKEY